MGVPRVSKSGLKDETLRLNVPNERLQNVIL